MITELNHYNVQVADLEASIRFYRDVLGLNPGPRPNFTFNGAWLYCGETPVVHLAAAPVGAVTQSGRVQEAGPAPSTGRLDHVAFTCRNLPEFRAKLDSLGVSYVHRDVPGGRVIQLFISDPDGVRIELNFPRDG